MRNDDILEHHLFSPPHPSTRAEQGSSMQIMNQTSSGAPSHTQEAAAWAGCWVLGGTVSTAEEWASISWRWCYRSILTLDSVFCAGGW